jgi:hypothetical protein
MIFRTTELHTDPHFTTLWEELPMGCAPLPATLPSPPTRRDCKYHNGNHTPE